MRDEVRTWNEVVRLSLFNAVRRRDLDRLRRQSELPSARVFARAWRTPLPKLNADVRETCATTQCFVLASPRVYFATVELERDLAMHRGAKDECCARRTSTSRVLLARGVTRYMQPSPLGATASHKTENPRTSRSGRCGETKYVP